MLNHLDSGLIGLEKHITNHGRYFGGVYECVAGQPNNEKNVVANIEEVVKPGDILFQHFSSMGRHVLIYVGEVDGEPSVIHMGGITKDSLHNHRYCAVGRITSKAAENIDPSYLTGVNISGSWDEDEEIVLEDNFYGLPLEGEYAGRTTIGGWIFDLLTQFLDYLTGIIFTLIKIQIIGWVRIFENGITDIINTITRTETTSDIDEKTEQGENPATDTNSQNGDNDKHQSSTDKDVQIGKINNEDENDVITIEDIVYNRVPILDVNVFNFKEAAGVQLQPDSVIYKLRETIAKWYDLFRRVSIVVMLAILIYLGISMALASTSEKKANINKAITAWVTGFILLFFIHYIMIFVLNLNSSFVDLFNNIIDAKTESQSVEGTIYDTLLTRAYSLTLSKGLPGTIMYLVLVYYMIKFLFIYIKRYIVINILTLMAPVMVLKYTFERAKNGKNSKTISSWLQDYVFNVLIQLVHALLYATLMIIALNMSSESLAGFIIALVIMNFMSKADKIFMKIFNFARGKSTEDVSKPMDMKDMLIGFSMASSLASDVKGVAKGVGHIAMKPIKAVGNFGFDVSDRLTGGNSRDSIKNTYYKASFGLQGLVDKKILRGKNKGFSKTLAAKRAVYLNGGTGDKELDDKIKKTLKARKLQKRKMRSNAFKYGTSTIGNAGKLLISIPMLVVDTGKGFALASTVLSSMRASGKSINGYIPSKSRFYPKNAAARTLLNIATLGAAGATNNAFINAKKDKEKITGKLPEELETLTNTGIIQSDIDKLYKELTGKDSEEDSDQNSDEDDKNENTEFDRFLNGLTQDQINMSDVKNEVDQYMFANGVEQLGVEDVSSVVKNIERLYGKEVSQQYRSSLEDNIKSEFRKKMNEEKSSSLSIDEAVDAIKEGVLHTHSVNKSSLDKKSQQIVEKVEELNRLEMNTSKKQVDASKIIKKIQKNNNKKK